MNNFGLNAKVFLTLSWVQSIHYGTREMKPKEGQSAEGRGQLV